MTGLSPQIPDISRGLPPVSDPRPLILILGSFPSVLSLANGEYYGNPRNRFWAVMEELSGIPASLPYPERIKGLTQEGIALWDVVATCSRPGSADSRIRDPVPNDIAGFVRANPTIRLVALNGSTAGRLYHRLADVKEVPSVILPSTSPANAAVTFAGKVKAWNIVRITSTQKRKERDLSLHAEPEEYHVVDRIEPAEHCHNIRENCDPANPFWQGKRSCLQHKR